MEHTTISCLSKYHNKRSYLRITALWNMCPSSLCFGICWYPSVCWHLKLHLVCSLIETNCHTTLSVKRASATVHDPNRTNLETDEVDLALLTGRTTFWPQRIHAIGRCTLQSCVNRNICHVQVTDKAKLMLLTPAFWRINKTIIVGHKLRQEYPKTIDGLHCLC